MTENKLLSRATLLLVISDFLFFFIIFKFVTDITQNIFIGSASVSIKSLGNFAGAIILPRILNSVKIRKILILSIYILTISYLIILYIVNTNHSPIFSFSFLFLQSASFQIFSGAREILSKTFGDSKEQRSLQAEILFAFFGGQFIGPAIGFLFLYYSLNNLAIIFCSLISILALYYIFQIKSEKKLIGTKISNPIRYLRPNTKLFHIFLVRGILHWIPIGIFNYIVFAYIEKQLHLPKEFSTWGYCLVAFGSLIASYTLKKNILMERIPILQRIWSWFNQREDYSNASLAYICLSGLRIAMLLTASVPFSVILFLIGGFANGLNIVSAQSIRRRICSDEQNAEVVSLELATAKIVDGTVGIFCALLATNNYLTINSAMITSSISLFLLGLYVKFFLSFEEGQDVRSEA